MFGLTNRNTREAVGSVIPQEIYDLVRKQTLKWINYIIDNREPFKNRPGEYKIPDDAVERYVELLKDIRININTILRQMSPLPVHLRDTFSYSTKFFPIKSIEINYGKSPNLMSTSIIGHIITLYNIYIREYIDKCFGHEIRKSKMNWFISEMIQAVMHEITHVIQFKEMDNILSLSAIQPPPGMDYDQLVHSYTGKNGLELFKGFERDKESRPSDVGFMGSSIPKEHFTVQHNDLSYEKLAEFESFLRRAVEETHDYAIRKLKNNIDPSHVYEGMVMYVFREIHRRSGGVYKSYLNMPGMKENIYHEIHEAFQRALNDYNKQKLTNRNTREAVGSAIPQEVYDLVKQQTLKWVGIILKTRKKYRFNEYIIMPGVTNDYIELLNSITDHINKVLYQKLRPFTYEKIKPFNGFMANYNVTNTKYIMYYDDNIQQVVLMNSSIYNKASKFFKYKTHKPIYIFINDMVNSILHEITHYVQYRFKEFSPIIKPSDINPDDFLFSYDDKNKAIPTSEEEWNRTYNTPERPHHIWFMEKDAKYQSFLLQWNIIIYEYTIKKLKNNIDPSYIYENIINRINPYIKKLIEYFNTPNMRENIYHEVHEAFQRALNDYNKQRQANLKVYDPTGIVVLYLEYMNTPELQMKGLQHRDILDSDCGLLFPTTPQTGYHMNNVQFPIDICFLDDSGMILEIVYMEPEIGRARTPLGAKWAIESNPGFWRSRNLGIYNNISIPGII